MRKLSYLDEIYNAERIIKTDSEIIGYTNNEVVFRLSGINDFSEFTLIDGQGFDIKEQSVEDKIELLQAEKDQLADTLDMILTELIPKLLKGE